MAFVRSLSVFRASRQFCHGVQRAAGIDKGAAVTGGVGPLAAQPDGDARIPVRGTHCPQREANVHRQQQPVLRGDLRLEGIAAKDFHLMQPPVAPQPIEQAMQPIEVVGGV